MEQYSLFDIIGPAMIGPSSSHTAGAATVGYLCRRLFDRPVKEAIFRLHGSFAKTYRGHGTDIALIAGVCGLKPDDPRIPTAKDLAETLGVHYEFIESDLGEVHPNTVEVTLIATDGHQQVFLGSSIGGGKAKIVAIDGLEVSINGALSTLIVEHLDRPGFVANFTGILSKEGINIAAIKLYREQKGAHAVMVLEIDETIEKEKIATLKEVQHLVKLTFFEAIKG